MIIPIYGIPINKQPLAKATPNMPNGWRDSFQEVRR